MRLPAKRAKMAGTASSASAGSDDEIRLRVETISGEVIQLVVSKYETVLKLKNRIFKKQGEFIIYVTLLTYTCDASL